MIGLVCLGLAVWLGWFAFSCFGVWLALIVLMYSLTRLVCGAACGS